MRIFRQENISTIRKINIIRMIKNEGSTEIRTRVAGFRVQSANHYTIEPTHSQRYNVEIY